MPPLFQVNWSAPKNICATTTTCVGGVSKPPYASNNLALHVGDDPENVMTNRHNLQKTLALPNQPIWLEQTHSNHCITAEETSLRIADAVITRDKNISLAIMTADCLPILLCNNTGTEIAAIHAGWRGLAEGIIENTLQKMQSPPESLLAWTGPAICPNCFEIGEEVKQCFIQKYPYSQPAFHHKNNQLYGDLPKLAEMILYKEGVRAIDHADACTVERNKQFYSYRRGSQTGRMATLIWFNTL